MLMRTRSLRVILYQPPYSGTVIGPPLGLLSLAGSLRDAGYEPVLIDGMLEPDPLARIQQESKKCAAFGVSLLTGLMIRHGISSAKLVRRLRPEVPIIFGGWHPTLATEETLREEFVDIIVRNQGDRTLVEVLDRVATGESLSGVAGCWFKEEGKIRANPDRPIAALSDLPRPAYDLVDFDAYERKGGVRKLPYATSTGCPYACNYCTDLVYYGRRFNAYDAERAAAEMAELASRYRLEEIALVDSNFLVDVRRAIAIAEGIIRSGVRFRWTFQASTDLLCRMSDEEVRLLARSGVTHIGFGTESASPEILKAMDKSHQRIEDIGEAARKCSRADIRATLNLIFGYPGEEERHRRQTLAVMGQIAARYPSVTFSPNIFTAYPGLTIWPDLLARGVRRPHSLEKWADIDAGAAHLPWLTASTLRDLRRSLSYFLLNNQLGKAEVKSASPLRRRLLNLCRKPLHWRLRRHQFSLPWELWLSMSSRWLIMRRSLITGQPLSRLLSRSA